MSSTNSKPVVVLVPGMCCVGPVVFRPLISQLLSLGWTANEVICIDNPSVDAPKKGNQLKPNGLDVDIQSLRQIISKVIEVEHRDVLLVAHSYGGAPSLSAAEGLWKHQRLARGETGGVLVAALIASPLILPGHSIAGDRMEWLTENNMPLDGGETFEVDGDLHLSPTGLSDIYYHDIAEPERQNYELRPSAMSTVLTPVKEHIDPKNWRVSYLICAELDLAMPEELQRDFIRKARDAGAEVQVQTLRSGHFPMINHTEEVARWLVGLV